MFKYLNTLFFLSKVLNETYLNMTISSKSILNKIKDQREKTLKYLEYKRIKRIRRNTIPPHTHCQNCNEKLEGMYCYKCGQYALVT